MKYYYTYALAFLAIVLYQTVAKKYGLPLVSNGLITIKNNSVYFFEKAGYLVGKLLNIWDWINRLQTLFEDLWRFVREHIWANIRPFFESILEIVQPVWQLLFSWVYFFVGFAKTHYIGFSYLGGAIVVGGAGYYTQSYWQPYCQMCIARWSWYCPTAALVVAVVGVLTAYPKILPDLFPTVHRVLVGH